MVSCFRGRSGGGSACARSFSPVISPHSPTSTIWLYPLLRIWAVKLLTLRLISLAWFLHKLKDLVEALGFRDPVSIALRPAERVPFNLDR